MELKVLDWSAVEQLVWTMAKQIRRHGQPVQHIVGVPRGGIVPAVLLAHRLGVKSVSSLPDIPVPMEDVLLVDDISDGGRTLENACIRVPRARSAVLLVRNTSKFRPTFYGEMIAYSNWIVFPWETDPIGDQAEYEVRK